MTRHVYLLLINLLIILAVGLAFASYVWVTNEDRARDGRIHSCIALNELSRKVYVTMLDLGYSELDARKFKPSLHCEDIP